MDRKKPVTAEEIANYFLISVALVRKNLNELHQENHAERSYESKPGGGRITLWALKRQQQPVAVPVKTPKPIRTPSVSYPHIRGYED